MGWYPHVTVATIIEDQGRFLLVEEQTAEGRVFNHPAGHLEANECLSDAAIREVLEETGYPMTLDGVVGIALYKAPSNGVTYHRTTFFGHVTGPQSDQPLDDGIIAAHWLTIEQLRSGEIPLRSPLVLQVIEQYLAGHRYPLSLLHEGYSL